MRSPPVWTPDQLEQGRQTALEAFRKRRMEEPLEDYLEAFDEYQGRVEELLESTVDLRDLDNRLMEVVSDPSLLEAFRYLAGPPVSADDLKELAEASLTPSRLEKDPAMAQRVARVVMNVLDRRRFPWVRDAREPSEAERGAAVLASAALMATRQVQTARRNVEKERQEDQVKTALARGGLTEVPPRTVNVLGEAPGRGEFCGESNLGERKADIIVGLWDGRTMPIECKVSNSSTNSVKRLNNDAAVKAEVWKNDFGQRPVVAAAVLSGVYKLHNLENAQARGLTLFWAHDLDQLIAWIEQTKS